MNSDKKDKRFAEEKLLDEFIKDSTYLCKKDTNYTFEDIEAFINDTNSFLIQESSSIIKDLKSIIQDEWDSMRLANHFESFSESEREEDISNKLAWYLEMRFIADTKIRNDQQFKVFQGLSLLVRTDHLQDKSQSIFPEVTNLKIKREVTSVRTGQRLDLKITDSRDQNILGIEVKIGDTNFLKSNEDHKDFRDGHFWLLIPEEDYEKILNDDIKLSMPILLWEDTYHFLKKSIEGLSVDPFVVFTQMFLSSIERIALGVLPINLYELINSERLSPHQINKIAKYYSFRRNKRGIHE